MKSKILLSLLLIVNIAASGQDIVYLDKEWNITDKDNAKYIREILKINDTLYKLTEKDTYGKTLMTGEYSSLDPLTENGSFIFSTRACNYDLITGQYRNGDMVGDWFFKNGKKIVLTLNYDLELDECPICGDPESDENTVFVIVEDMPTFRNGDINTFRDYCSKKVHYPPMAAYRRLSGRTYTCFVVNESGRLCNLQNHMNPSCKDFNREALRVIVNSTGWKCGRQRGKPLKVRYCMPFMFNLDNRQNISVGFKYAPSSLSQQD